MTKGSLNRYYNTKTELSSMVVELKERSTRGSNLSSQHVNESVIAEALFLPSFRNKPANRSSAGLPVLSWDWMTLALGGSTIALGHMGLEVKGQERWQTKL